MPPLSESATLILERMEPDRAYGVHELLAVIREGSVERLREIMHELWIDRQVERAGHSAWRRVQSAPPHRRDTVPRKSEAVTPQELFDHGTFADFFK